MAAVPAVLRGGSGAQQGTRPLHEGEHERPGGHQRRTSTLAAAVPSTGLLVSTSHTAVELREMLDVSPSVFTRLEVTLMLNYILCTCSLNRVLREAVVRLLP